MIKKKILIIGGDGFLGFNLIKKLSKINQFSIHALVRKKKFSNKKSAKVKYIYSDIGSLINLRKKLKTNYNFILNFSGNINHKKDFETKRVHFHGVKNMLKVINTEELKLFIQIGSSLEYGKDKSPQKEKIICKPISYYGKAKYMASTLLKKKITNFLILRPYQIYGPNQKADRLIPMVIKFCLQDKKFPCTNGNQLRDFLYVDDFSNLIIKILQKNKFKHNIYNVGFGKPVKVKKVIQLIFKKIKRGVPLYGKIKMRKDEIKKLYPNISRVKKEFKWKPKIQIENGLKKTIAFYAKK